MEKSKVYYTDFRTKLGEGLPTKLKRLIKKAGIEELDMDQKFVAIKMHFGELGNLSFLRPNYAKAVADVVKELGGMPFLTDCNTLYPGSRKNALEHLQCAWENGFTPLTVGCPVIIGDGLKGTDDIEVPVNGGEYIQNARIGRAIMDADVFISLTHFKGHEMTGFGGTIKNIGMGCGSRAGKKDQHSNGKPNINPDICRGCRRCQKECANNGLEFHEDTKKMTVNADQARIGAGRGYSNATDLADYLARKGIPFRLAHHIVGHIVNYCIKHDTDLEKMTLEEYKQFSDAIEDDIHQYITLEACVAARHSFGGTAPERVVEQINRAKARLNITHCGV